MLLQRLATGANGVKQARYRRRAARHSHAHAQYIHNASVAAVDCIIMNSAEGFAL